MLKYNMFLGRFFILENLKEIVLNIENLIQIIENKQQEFVILYNLKIYSLATYSDLLSYTTSLTNEVEEQAKFLSLVSDNYLDNEEALKLIEVTNEKITNTINNTRTFLDQLVEVVNAIGVTIGEEEEKLNLSLIKQ